MVTDVNRLQVWEEKIFRLFLDVLLSINANVKRCIKTLCVLLDFVVLYCVI